MENYGNIGTIQIWFREQFRDSIVYDNVVGYQVGGGALSVSRATGENEIFPLDLIQRVSFKLNEQE